MRLAMEVLLLFVFLLVPTLCFFMDPFNIIKKIASQFRNLPMELLGPILEIVNKIWTPIGKCLKYHRSLGENMENLERKLRELNMQKQDIESQLSSQLCPGKKPKSQVENWLEEVQSINGEIQTIKEEVRKRKYLSSVHLGKCVPRKIQEVEELHQKGNFLDGLVLDALPRKGEIFPPIKLAGETTAIRNMEEIWDDLMNDDTRLIGVYGMGGAGKTTVMKQINNRLLELTDKFDSAIWITASKVLDVIKLQDCIAKKCGVDLSGCEDETTRAARLFAGLEEKKRYVLILDDVWEAFELEYVGIPEPTISNGCKLVLTTRFLEICRNMRSKDIKMELRILLGDEAWNLFLDIVGRDVLLTPSVEATMKLVAEECACLPLAVVTIAGSMKGTVDECEWRNTLEELREATGELDGMEKVLKQLKHSYFCLKDEKLQHCLLYCALYPEDFEIDREELIKYLIYEGIVEGKRSRQAQFDKGHSLLNKLENACLLESVTHGTDYKYVKMHDLIRDMALQIMSRRCMVEARVQLRDLADEELWTKDLERVSLMDNNIREICSGVSPRCNRLSTLLLLRNRELRKILSLCTWLGSGFLIFPTQAFKSCQIVSPTWTISLHYCLKSGNLKYVPSLAKLGSLRKLDLSRSEIAEVPQGMEMLVNLRYLNLDTDHLKILPSGILPTLFRLQCLIVWWGSATLKVKAEEVASLRKLETFAGQFNDVPDFNTYVSSLHGWGPNKYLLQVGPGVVVDRFDEEEGSFRKHVILRKCSISRQGEDPLLLPDDIESLEIKECHDVSSLCDVSSLNCATNSFKYCRINKCDGIECVLSSSSSYYTPLQSLEVLKFYDLQNLRALFKGVEASPAPPSTFSCLQKLYVIKCPNIKKLFSPGLLSHLQNLELIDVRRCEGMEEIIAEEEEEGMGDSSINHSPIISNDDTIFTITLPKLKFLFLWRLRELKSIICDRGIMVCDSLEQISVKKCRKVTRLPLYLPMLNGQPSPPHALQYIEVDDRAWWESLEWDHPSAKDVLQHLATYARWW